MFHLIRIRPRTALKERRKVSYVDPQRRDYYPRRKLLFSISSLNLPEYQCVYVWDVCEHGDCTAAVIPPPWASARGGETGQSRAGSMCSYLKRCYISTGCSHTVLYPSARRSEFLQEMMRLQLCEVHSILRDVNPVRCEAAKRERCDQWWFERRF